MEIDLGPQGEFCPPRRLRHQDLEAIRKGWVWDPRVDSLEDAEEEYVNAIKDGTLTVTYAPEPPTKKGKDEPDNDADEEVGPAPTPDAPPIKVPTHWVDISSIEDIINKIDLDQWRMGMEDAYTKVTNVANARARDAHEPPPISTMGWQMFITAVFRGEAKGHGQGKNSIPLINLMVWEEAIVGMYRPQLINRGAGGMVRKKFEEILDSYCVPTLKPFFPSGKVDDTKFIWWDTFRAPENPKTCEKSLEELIRECRRIKEWKTVASELTRVNKIIENLPHIRSVNDEKVIPHVVHDALTAAFKVRFTVLTGLVCPR